jgi:ATP-dependent DNA ligase
MVQSDLSINFVEAPMAKTGRRAGVMLCMPFEEKRLERWRTPYILQPKLDGVRCRAIVDDMQVILYSSEMHIIDLVPHINEELRRLFNGRQFELDGELYFHGMNFQEIFSRTSRKTNRHLDSGTIEYHVFDVINGQNQAGRLTWLSQLFIDWVPDVSCVKYVEPSLVRDVPAIMEKYSQYIDEGYEGFIIREPYNIYKRKRSTEIMKFKPHQIDEYTISGYSCEMDQYGNLKPDILGRFICASMSDMSPLYEYPAGIKVPEGYFGAGTGPSLTQEKRINLWKDKEGLVGRKLKVKYQTLTSGKNIPRFPVALEVL